MKIIVDAMGGDNAPDEIVKGAVEACQAYNVELILTGKVETILRSLEKMGLKELPKCIQVANASEVVAMCDDPVAAAREKKDSSMSVGLRMLRDGNGDAFVSAGSTGALLTASTLTVGRVKGIRRAALAPVLPVTEKGAVLIDCGANAECTPEYLLQFAFMGAFYADRVLKIDKPRIGLLNIGTEENKGGELQRAAHALLTEAAQGGAFNFVGNVESKGAMLGECDVIVADGYTGNILLKAIEGTAAFIMREIKASFMKNALTKLAALMVKGEFSSLKARLNADSVGGTALLGIAKPVIKAHGSSNAASIKNAIRQAVASVDAAVADDIRANIDRMKVTDISEKNP